MNLADQLVPAIVMTEALVFSLALPAFLVRDVRRWRRRRRSHPREISRAWERRCYDHRRTHLVPFRCRWVDGHGWRFPSFDSIDACFLDPVPPGPI